MNTRLIRPLMVAALVLCAYSSVRSQSPQTYTITDLGTLGGTISAAADINASGEVVGWARTSDEMPHAFQWKDGVMTDLGTLGWTDRYRGTIAGTQSWATGINASGQVVGESYTPGNGAFHAFLWDNWSMTDLGTLAAPHPYYSAASAINASGQVVGWAHNEQGQRAFLWQNGMMRDLGTLGGAYGFAYDINDAGQVVGAALLPGEVSYGGVYGGFLWQDGVMTEIPAGARAINASGVVLGGDFLWQNGVITSLNLPPHLGGTTNDINGSGEVVGGGWCENDEGGPPWHVPSPDAFLWRNGTVTNLNTLLPPDSGWVLEAAMAINDSGQIVGCGYLNNQRRAFLLTPVTPTPEPGAPKPVPGDPTHMPVQPIAVPGTLEAENYDPGGAGVSYVDLTEGNSGGVYRTDDVDISWTHGDRYNFTLMWMSAGEWLQYTIDVAVAGTYTVEAQVASDGAGGTFHVEANGAASGSLQVPDTGGWQQWQTVTTTLELQAGVQHLRILLDSDGSTGAVGNLDSLRLTP